MCRQSKLQILPTHRRVPLRRRHRRVPQKLLHHPEVRTVPQQKRRYGVPQHVGGHLLLDAGKLRGLGEDSGDALGGEGVGAGVEEEAAVAISCSKSRAT